MVFKKLREALAHPYTAASGAAGAFLGFVHYSTLEALFWALVGNSGHIFTASTIAGFTLPQVFPSLAAFKPFLLPIIGVSGLAYFARLAYTTYKNTDEKV